MYYRSIVLAGAITLAFCVPTAEAQERWQGLYGGIAIAGQDVTANVERSAIHRYSEDALSLGVYGGKNFVSANGFVWGPDVLLTSLSTPGARRGEGLGTTSFRGTFLLSPRVRLGFATDNVMFYGVLGAGITDATVRSAGRGDGGKIIARAAYGVGMEFATSELWSVRAEAVTYNLNVDDRGFGFRTRDIDGDIGQISIGLSRKF